MEEGSSPDKDINPAFDCSVFSKNLDLNQTQTQIGIQVTRQVFKSQHQTGSRYMPVILAVSRLTVFALLFGICSAAVPVTGCTSVSTNTGSGFPTTLPNLANNLLTLSEPLPAGSTDSQIYVSSYDDAGTDINFFTKDGISRLSSTLNPANGDHYKSVILKDPLKLFLASSDSQDITLYPVTVSGITYTLGTSNHALIGATYTAITISLSDPSSAFIYAHCSATNNGLKIDTSSNPMTVSVGSTVSSTKFAFYMGFMYSGARIFAGGPQYLSLYNKADFSTIKNFAWHYSSETVRVYCADNLSPNYLFAHSKSSFSYINRLDMNDPAPVVPFGYTNSYLSSANNILNFGPYQYVVTIPTGSTSINMVFYSKANINPTNSFTVQLSNAAVSAYTDSFTGFVFDAAGVDRVYFAIITNAVSNRNFQSYYLTVDRCTTRAGAVCTACLPAYYLVTMSPNNDCLLTTEFPPGYGVVTSLIQKGAACTVSHCLSCVNDNGQCQACDPATGWFLDGNLCRHASLAPTMPSGKGPDLGTGLVVACADTNCLLCKANQATCTGCNTAAGWFLDGNLCRHASLAPTMPSGKGPDLGTGLVVACADTNCLLCKANQATCTGCNTAAGWFLDGNLCRHASLAPVFLSSKGPNLATGAVVACQQANCLKCTGTYVTCTACDTSKGFYLIANPSQCVSPGQLIDTGTGADLASGVVKSCVAHCVDCHADASACTKADQANDYYLQNGTVVFIMDIKPGLGANPAKGIVSPCTSEGCTICKKSFTVCEACDSSGGYVLKNSSCQLKTTQADLQFSRFSVSSSTAEIQFTASLKKNTRIQEPFTFRILDILENKEYTCREIACQLKEVQENSIILAFNSPVGIIKGELLIDSSPDFKVQFEDQSIWAKYPIKVPDVSFLAKGGATSTAGSALTSLNSARMPLSIFLAFAAPAAASYLDNLMNTLYLLKMMEGPSLTYPDAILEASLDLNLLPIPLDNPFYSWASGGPTCAPSQQFAKSKVECNFLSNEGVNLLVVAGLFVFTLAATVVANYLLKCLIRKVLAESKHLQTIALEDLEKEKELKANPINEGSSKTKEKPQIKLFADVNQPREGKDLKSRAAFLVKKIGTVLGLQFFIIKLEGNQVEMTLVGFVAMKYSSGYEADVISAVLAVLFLVYYTSLAYFGFRNSRWIWNELDKLRLQGEHSKPLVGKINDHVDLTKTPFRLLTYHFEDMLVPSRSWQLLLPLANYCRTTALCMVVAFVIDLPPLQITLALLVEAALMLLEFKADLACNRAEYRADITLRGFTILYLIMKGASTALTLSETARQKRLGVAMALVLAFLILAGIIFALYTIGFFLVKAVRAIVTKIRSYKKLKKLMNGSEIVIKSNKVFHKISPIRDEVELQASFSTRAHIQSTKQIADPKTAKPIDQSIGKGGSPRNSPLLLSKTNKINITKYKPMSNKTVGLPEQKTDDTLKNTSFQQASMKHKRKPVAPKLNNIASIRNGSILRSSVFNFGDNSRVESTQKTVGVSSNPSDPQTSLQNSWVSPPKRGAREVRLAEKGM